MIVHSAHLTMHLWIAAATSAFNLLQFAIKLGSKRGWSDLQHALAGGTVGIAVLGIMLFTAWRLTPTPTEIWSIRACAALRDFGWTCERASAPKSVQPEFLRWPAMLH
jgi:hypothetical protein